METLHHLAGVQDAFDLQASSDDRPSQAHSISSHDRHATGDGGTGSGTTTATTTMTMDNNNNNNIDTNGSGQANPGSHRASRATLPLNRQPSHRSFKSGRSGASAGGANENNKGGGGIQSGTGEGGNDLTAPPVPALPKDNHFADGAGRRQSRGTTGSNGSGNGSNSTDDNEEDFPWGPNHPCFPHPNPHCAADSPESRSTRVIRVKRDWLSAGDLYPQFANLYPEILDPLVSDADFRLLIANLNAKLKAAFNPFSARAYLDAALGVATGFVWEDVGWTGAKRGEKGVDRFLEAWNAERERAGKEVRVVSLRRTGFMSLDFIVPDPGIDGTWETEGEGRQGEGGGGIGLAE